MSDDQIDMSEDKIEKLEVLLECSVCRSVPRQGPVYQCENGHLTCAECTKRLSTTCPVCRIPLPKTKIRSVAIEQIIENCDFPSECSFAGCGHVAPRDALKLHEAECAWRGVPCPSVDCGKTVAARDLLDHVAEHADWPVAEIHESGISQQSWNLSETDLALPSIRWELARCCFQGHIFFPMFYKRGHRYHVWMTVLAGKTVADQFRVAVIIKGPATSVVHQAKVFPVDLKKRHVLKDIDNVFSFDEALARRLFVSKVNDSSEGERRGKFKVMYQLMPSDSVVVDSLNYTE